MRRPFRTNLLFSRLSHPRRWKVRTWVIAIMILGIGTGWLFDYLFGQIISLRPEDLRERLDQLGPWGPLVFIVVLALAVVISPIPSIPLDIAAGLAFGLVAGTIYTLIGAEIGAIIAFLIARRLGRPRLARWVPSGVMNEIDELARRSGVRAILVMRLLPVFQFDWVSYAAGLSAMSFRAFAIATFVGMIPPVIAIVAVGATLPTNPLLAGTLFAILVLGVVIPLLLPSQTIARLRRSE